MPLMKTLSIRAPWWPWFLPDHPSAKRHENRNWWTPYRGPVLIHASKFWREDDIKLDMGAARSMAHDAGWPGGNPMGMTLEEIKRLCGHVVAIAEVTGCVSSSPSPWFVGKYAHVFSNVRKLERPFPVKGALGYFTVDVSADQLQ